MRFPLWRRRRLDEELEEEIQAHLEMAKRDRMERGENVSICDQMRKRRRTNTMMA